MIETNQDRQMAVQAAVARLRQAEVSGVSCAPVRDLIGAEDVATAYRVQEQLASERVQRGARVVGRKIGLTSPAVQQQLGVDQPDFGMLFDDMAHETGAIVDYASVLQPKVEAEVAFVLKSDLADGELNLSQVRATVDYVVAAVEICGSRISNWDITFGDTVADNASAGAYVLGTQRRTLDDFEPREVEMTMTVTGQEQSTGHGSACLGDPLLAVQWLARQARELGQPLRAGQVILSGALGPMRPVAPGAEVMAELGGLGSVSITFSNHEEASR